MLNVKILSPEKTLFSGEAESVKVPGEKGRFEILPGHAPIISSLIAGKVVCSGKDNLELDIKGGFVDVKRDKVSVCVEL